VIPTKVLGPTNRFLPALFGTLTPSLRPQPIPSILALLLGTVITWIPGVAGGQELVRLFPPRDLMPGLLAGPRDPVTSASLLGVVRNPSAHGRGVEVEFSIGTTLPVFLLGGSPEENPLVVGIEAAAFARFGLQVLQRELVATDWFFAVPVIRHHDNGWTRFRYYHSSSHMGDEYSRRFGDPGINLSRDAVEVLAFRSPLDGLGAWAGIRYGYNVHPQEDKRWVFRAGGQLRPSPMMDRSCLSWPPTWSGTRKAECGPEWR